MKSSEALLGVLSTQALAAGRPEEAARASLEGGPVRGEGWRVRKTGERYRANVVLTAIYDAGGSARLREGHT
jgi:hypothetical protein